MSRKNRNRSVSKPAAATTARTSDSFANFQARLGWGADNQASASTYTLTYQSRNRIWLEAAYRGSWIVGKAIDAPAEDMTRAGIKMSGIAPDQIEILESGFTELAIWESICDTIKWARLYGGAIAVMLIEGQDFSQPLRVETIGKGQFKGLLVLDRWMLNPPVGEVVDELGPDLGKPKYYDVLPVANLPISQRHIHYSRVIRLEGADLPYYQRITENGWGLSVLEPLWDRLVAFDSTSVGAAQLVYKAHLRTIKIKGFREIVATGGQLLEAVKKQLEFIRLAQTNEGLTVIDGEDEFDAQQYTFSGLSDMLIQFGQQLSGATGIPLTRLFGQAPAGLNATGEGDMKQYHEDIGQKQERRLRNPLHRLMRVMSMSRRGVDLEKSFQYSFNSLQQMSEGEKADVAQKTTNSVIEAVDAGLIDKATGLKELKASSASSGLFGNITDEMIEAAEQEGQVAQTDPPGPEGIGLPEAGTTRDSFFRRFFKGKRG